MLKEISGDMFDLSGRTALVTGGASGIGRGMAHGLAHFGANVVIADVNEELGPKVTEEIQSIGRESLYIRADVSKKENVAEMVRETVGRFGRLDIGVNSAGVIGTRLPQVERIEEAEARRLYDIMLFGVFFCCQEEGRQMLEQGEGRIINIASMSGVIVNRGVKGIAPYCGIKGGIIHMTKAFASEWADKNITVNAISPGYTRTPVNAKVFDMPEWHRTYMDQIPMQRFASPKDMTGACVFLASDAAGYVTGHNLVIDGGVTIW
jgi:NAD(P)-dependent dehydrogenase (short-subunit alcohol dehydrogenase family)